MSDHEPENAGTRQMVLKVQGEFHNAEVPHQYTQHPLIADRHFFTLPIELLEAILERVGGARFDPTLLSMERQLSARCGDHSWLVGFRDGLPITYRFLGEPLSLPAMVLDLPDDWKAQLGWGHNKFDAMKQADSWLHWIRQTGRAYCGWLSTNEQFVQEHQTLCTQWAAQIRVCGLTGSQCRVPEFPEIPGFERREEYQAALAAFCERWYLEGLSGPFLPMPLPPQIPVPSLDLVTRAMRSGGLCIYLPFTYPLPNRDQLRAMLEEAMDRQAMPEHLTQWAQIVQSDNPAGQAEREHLARVFLLQHFWRALFERHASALKGKVDLVRRAFAAFLFPKADDVAGQKAESVRKDLGLLAKAHGGADWYLRPSVYRSL